MSRLLSYMAVQRWKPAESLALRGMDTTLRAQMRPLVETRLTRGLSKNAKPAQVTEELAPVAEQIGDDCRGYEVFLDGIHLDRLMNNGGQVGGEIGSNP